MRIKKQISREYESFEIKEIHKPTYDLSIQDLYDMIKPLVEEGFGNSLIVANNRYLNNNLYYKDSIKILFIGTQLNRKFNPKSEAPF